MVPEKKDVWDLHVFSRKAWDFPARGLKPASRLWYLQVFSHICGVFIKMQEILLMEFRLRTLWFRSHLCISWDINLNWCWCMWNCLKKENRWLFLRCGAEQFCRPSTLKHYFAREVSEISEVFQDFDEPLISVRFWNRSCCQIDALKGLDSQTTLKTLSRWRWPLPFYYNVMYCSQYL